jgi:hypothetical protein
VVSTRPGTRRDRRLVPCPCHQMRRAQPLVSSGPPVSRSSRDSWTSIIVMLVSSAAAVPMSSSRRDEHDARPVVSTSAHPDVVRPNAGSPDKHRRDEHNARLVWVRPLHRRPSCRSLEVRRALSSSKTRRALSRLVQVVRVHRL